MAAGALLALFTQITILFLITSLLVLLAGIGALVFLHVLIVGRAFSTAARGADQWPGCFSSRGLLPDEINELPSAEFNPGLSGAADCAVCLEGLRAGERCRALPRCRHVFHVQCADSWLIRAAVCPVCRAAVAGARSGGAGPGAGVDVIGFPVGGGR